MAKKDNTTAYLLLGIAAVLFITRQQPQQQHYPNYPAIPPAPPRSNGHAWADWARSIVQIYGNVATLWQPGGPFYRVNQTDVQQVLQGWGNVR